MPLTDPNNFEYRDYDINASKYYYRVKAKQSDGSFRYSSVVALDGLSKNKFLLLSNIVGNTLTVVHTDKDAWSFRIISSDGRVMMSEAVQQKDNLKFEFDVSVLRRGVYFIQFISSAGSFTERFIKQ